MRMNYLKKKSNNEASSQPVRREVRIQHAGNTHYAQYVYTSPVLTAHLHYKEIETKYEL
jgi:hypothetical protein